MCNFFLFNFYIPIKKTCALCNINFRQISLSEPILIQNANIFFKYNFMTNQNLLNETIAFVKKELENAEGGHDWFHIEREIGRAHV